MPERDDTFDASGLPTPAAALEKYWTREASWRGWTRSEFAGLCRQYAHKGLSARSFWRKVEAEVEQR